jgi:hypothetical protein
MRIVQEAYILTMDGMKMGGHDKEARAVYCSWGISEAHNFGISTCPDTSDTLASSTWSTNVTKQEKLLALLARLHLPLMQRK